jgi:anti-sigma B factor antagonist
MADKTSKLQIVERQVDDVTLLILTGEITLDDGELAFGRRVDDLVLKQGRRKILVDLGGVTYIDSAGVGMMAAELKIVRAKGGALKLLHLAGHGQRVLAVLKLMTVFESFDDEALAIRSFSRQ